MRCEFATHNTEDTLDTMVEDAHVNHVPLLPQTSDPLNGAAFKCET